MRALSREEQALFDEMKERCLAKGQYKDEKAKDKFKMLCHLEDFEIQYWELLKENKKIKECYCNRTDCSGRIKNSRKYDSLYQKYNKQLDNWNKLKEDLIKIRQLTFTKYNKNEWENCLSFNDDILPLIEKMKELEQESDSNE